MKNNIIILSLAILITGCSFVPNGYLGHTTNTQVVLSEANYKIIGRVTGEASAINVLGFRVGSTAPLYADAKKDMMKEVDINYNNKSIALINFTSDEQIKYIWFYLPFMTEKTVYVSADVIEFIPEN